MVPGVAGAVVGVIEPVVAALEVPQAFEAVTETVPAAEPMVMVAAVVPCPPVMAHPVPVRDQVYDVAPVTAAIE